MWVSNARARSAMSWRVWPNLAKSKSIASASRIAIGSSMIASGRRASRAREFSVISAVSEMPVRVAFSLAGLIAEPPYPAATLPSVRRLRVVVDDL